MDELSKQAALEHRAERVDDLFRAYVKALHEAQATCLMSDWYCVGQAWKRFIDAAGEADIDPRGPAFVREIAPP